MTSVLNVDSIAAKDGTSPVGLTKQSAAKMWVNFDGTASGAASRDSFNVSGMTDDATGKYTASYTNSMSNGTYAFTTATVDTSTISRGGNTLNLRDGNSPETGSIKLEGRYGANAGNDGGLMDQDFMFVTVMGDLA
tara:strand:+ start:300 stop:707 length:408 start_codon:yes stop_codon:yes gene_type:complete